MNYTIPGSIRNLDRYKQAKLLDFSGLYGSMPLNSISPSDLDFIVERHGRFLIGEIKLQGVLISDGQRKLLDALLSCLKYCWIFVAEHQTPNGEIIDVSKCYVVECMNDKIHKRFEFGELSVLDLCYKWKKTF